MSVKKRSQKQMEFYLSPSNLRHDKFLQQQMQLHEDGYISLDVFLTFNRFVVHSELFTNTTLSHRMKALGATMRILSEAIEKSPYLMLNDEKTHVRPKDLPDLNLDDKIGT
jgi:La-related protein 7